ncbi:tyrosine protein phosphatase, partial [bacterium]
MPYLVVSSLAALPATVAEHGALDLVTLINTHAVVDRPAGIEPHRHLFLGMNDIAEPAEGLVLPADSHLARLLAFGRSWSREAPLALHCYAGISRSTAAAYILALALDPERDEAE